MKIDENMIGKLVKWSVLYASAFLSEDKGHPKARQISNTNRKQKYHNANNNDFSSIAKKLRMEDLFYWVTPIIN